MGQRLAEDVRHPFRQARQHDVVGGPIPGPKPGRRDRPVGTPIGPNHHRDPREDHRNAEPLPHRQSHCEEPEEIVGLAREFRGETQHAVADEERAGDGARGAWLAREPPQDREEQEALERDLVELRRMARERLAIDLREPHAPRHVGRPAGQLAVDEIADAPRREPGWNQRRDEIHRGEPAALAHRAEDRDRDEHADEAAVEAHAARPDLQDLQRMAQVMFRLVEEDVAQAPAEDHAEHAVEEHVVDILLGDAEAEALAHAPFAQDDHQHEREQVHEPVPAHGERAEAEGDRIELRMDEHAGALQEKS